MPEKPIKRPPSSMRRQQLTPSTAANRDCDDSIILLPEEEVLARQRAVLKDLLAIAGGRQHVIPHKTEQL